MTEFCWKKLLLDDMAKTITVFDVKGVGLGDLKGDVMTFVKRSSALMQDHYPERAEVVIIANAPSWFSFLYALLTPLINERTQKKVRIFKEGSATLKGLLEYMDISVIPKRLGGEKSDVVDVEELRGDREGDGQEVFDGNMTRWFSEDEVKFRAHVRNANNSIELKKVV